MVRNYKRKTQRGAYGPDNLRAALRDLKEDKSSRSVAKKYGISNRTLARHRDCKVNEPGVINLGNSLRALPDEIEVEIANHVLEMSNRMFGSTASHERMINNIS